MQSRTGGYGATARAALLSYAVLGTPPEAQFDIFPKLALTALDAGSALLAFFDGDRMWIKAAAGSFGVDDRVAAEHLARTFELGQANAVAGDSDFYCGAPVFTIDGHAIGAIGVFGRRPHSAVPAPLPLLVALSEAVTQALEARKRAGATSAPRGRGLVAFDPADWSVIFADEETARLYGATQATMERLTLDDVFHNVDPPARLQLDLLTAASQGRICAFTAHARGQAFWNPVTCTARMVSGKRAHPLVVVEFSVLESARTRTNLHALTPPQANWEEHSIEAVFSKIEAGRRLLRGEQTEAGTALTAAAFVSAVGKLLDESSEPHLLSVFALGPHSAKDVLAQARRARLVCDHDLAVELDDGHLAILLRDMPVAIGRQALSGFARPLLGATFVICDVKGPNADVGRLLNAALAGLEG